MNAADRNSRIRVAVVGYGNIGRFAVEAVHTAQDMELAGVVRRSVDHAATELSQVKQVTDVAELEAAISASRAASFSRASRAASACRSALLLNSPLTYAP